MKDAALPPEWVSRLPKIRQELEAYVDEAEAAGAFLFTITFKETQHDLYIRPQGLFDLIMKKLTPVAGNFHERGVLLWGFKGMGKTSLAQDVACEFAFNPGEQFVALVPLCACRKLL